MSNSTGQKIKNGSVIVKKDTQGNITSKIDIVAHSMGYAYFLGIADAIKESDIGIKFGRLYEIDKTG